MSCREINILLDTHAPEALTPAQHATIDTHFASCEACREDWANWRGVAALAIPEMPPTLAARIAAMLPAHGPRRVSAERRPGRAFVFGGLLIAGAALAATLSLQIAQEARPGDEAVPPQSAPATGAALPDGQSVRGSSESGATPEDIAPPKETDAGADVTLEGGLDPRSVVVVARPAEVAGAIELEEFAKCHSAIVEKLQGIAGINTIAGPRVESFDGGGLDDWEIARTLGAGYLLVVSTDNGCNAYLLDSRATGSRDSVAGGMYGGLFPAADGWAGFASSMADSVREALLEDPATRVAEAQATLFNAALSDLERIHALSELQDGLGPTPGAFDGAVVAAAAQIGLSSADPAARQGAWLYLQDVDDPYLVQPLLQALANDPEAEVRSAAALALNTFLDEPGVKDDLLRAATEDPSREPSVACCIPTVRESAEWASMATADLPAFARRKLLDDTLPARSRLFWLGGWSPDGRFIFTRDLGEDAPAVIFDIGRNESDPRVRQMAWRALGRARHPEFVPVLLDDLKNHPDEYLRATAAVALEQYLDLPEVLAAFAEAANDPSMEVRRMVARPAGGNGL